MLNNRLQNAFRIHYKQLLMQDQENILLMNGSLHMLVNPWPLRMDAFPRCCWALNFVNWFRNSNVLLHMTRISDAWRSRCHPLGSCWLPLAQAHVRFDWWWICKGGRAFLLWHKGGQKDTRSLGQFGGPIGLSSIQVFLYYTESYLWGLQKTPRRIARVGPYHTYCCWKCVEGWWRTTKWTRFLQSLLGEESGLIKGTTSHSRESKRCLQGEAWEENCRCVLQLDAFSEEPGWEAVVWKNIWKYAMSFKNEGL